MVSNRRSVNSTGHLAGSWLLPVIRRWTALGTDSMVAVYAGIRIAPPPPAPAAPPGPLLGRSAAAFSPGPGARSVQPRRARHSLTASLRADPVTGRGGPPVGLIFPGT